MENSEQKKPQYIPSFLQMKFFSIDKEPIKPNYINSSNINNQNPKRDYFLLTKEICNGNDFIHPWHKLPIPSIELDDNDFNSDTISLNSIDDSQSDSVTIRKPIHFIKKRKRYFEFELKEEMDIPCYNCKEIGHISKNCPYLNRKNTNIEINDNILNKFPFIKNNEIEREKAQIKCDKCNNIGHDKESCLVKTEALKIEDMNNKMKCYFCGSDNHLVCPLNDAYIIDFEIDEKEIKWGETYKDDTDFVDLKNFDSILKYFTKEKDNNMKSSRNIIIKKKKTIFENIPNEEIKNIIFCFECGGRHNHSKCPKYNIRKLERNNQEGFKYSSNTNNTSNSSKSDIYSNYNNTNSPIFQHFNQQRKTQYNPDTLLNKNPKNKNNSWN